MLLAPNTNVNLCHLSFPFFDDTAHLKSFLHIAVLGELPSSYRLKVSLDHEIKRGIMNIYVITMVPCHLPKDDSDLTASRLIQQIREALKKNGGEPVLPILMGDATVYESIALEPLLGPFDALITRHKSIAAYRRATQSEEYQLVSRGKQILTFGFTNNFMYVDFFLPALKQVHGVVGEKVDTDSKIFVQAGGRVDYSLFQATGDRGLDNYRRHVYVHPRRACYMIAFQTKKDTPEGKADDLEHTAGWNKAMFSKGIEMLYQGKLVSLDKGPKAFREVAVYKFTSRELFAEMMESDHYVELAQLEERFILDRFVELCLPVY